MSYVEFYRKSGYQVLNKTKAGNLGKSDRYWTEEVIREEALRFTNRTDFWKNSSAAHSAARELGCLDRVCSHMPRKKVVDGHWSDENIRAESLKYRTRAEFNTAARGCYTIAYKRGILDEVCSHMKKPKRGKNRNKCLFSPISR